MLTWLGMTSLRYSLAWAHTGLLGDSPGVLNSPPPLLSSSEGTTTMPR